MVRPISARAGIQEARPRATRTHVILSTNDYVTADVLSNHAQQLKCYQCEVNIALPKQLCFILSLFLKPDNHTALRAGTSTMYPPVVGNVELSSEPCGVEWITY